MEPGFSLGGPVLKDKAWFFVAYQPTMGSHDTFGGQGQRRHAEREYVHGR